MAAMAGRKASTNQSDTSAAAPPDNARTPSASDSGQTGPSSMWTLALAPGPPAIEKGIDAPKTISNTTEVITDSSTAWPWSGAPGAVASVGIVRAATDNNRSVAIKRTRSRTKRCTPWRSPPAMNARPRTSSVFARIDPIRAVWTRTTNPAWSAKIEMKSSGRLPSADWRTPVAPGPKR